MKLQALINEICRLTRAGNAREGEEIRQTLSRQLCCAALSCRGIPLAPEREELRNLLRAQSPATIFAILTLWRLGRGDFDPRDDWLDEYLESGASFPTVNEARDYLMRKRLPCYLEPALRLLEEAGVEIDNLLA